MQIRLTVLGPRGGRACDVLVTAPAGTALGAVAGALAASVASGQPARSSGPAVALYAGARRLDPRTALLGVPPLVDGAVLSLHAASDHEHPDPDRPAHLDPAIPARLHVIGGPDAGGVHLLHGGQVRIGRSADADVPLDDPDVSRLHCAVTVSVGAHGPEVHVADLGSTNGTTIDGRPVGERPMPLLPGSLLRIGESTLRLETQDRAPGDADTPPPPLSPPVVPDSEGHLKVSLLHTGPGPAGRGGALSPRTTEALGTAPTLPVRGGPGASGGPGGSGGPGAEAPTLAGRAGALGARSGSESTAAEAAAARGGLSGAIGAWARRITAGRPGGRSGADDDALARLAAEAEALRERYPDPAAVLVTALGPGPRLWERGPGHPQALTVRLGTADVAREDGILPAVPVTADLRRAGCLGLTGPRPRLSGLARSVIAQLAALHAPGCLELVLISADRARPAEQRVEEWSWLNWLPQLRPAHGQECRLLLAFDRDQAEARTAELARRCEDGPLGPGWPAADRAAAEAAAAERHGPYTVVVVDGDPGSAGLRETVARLAVAGPSVGIHLICLAESADRLAAECGTVARLTGEVATLLAVTPEGPEQAAVDAVSAAWAERFARALAPLREADGGGRRTRNALPPTARLLDALDLALATPSKITARWAQEADVPRAVLGVGPEGPLSADLAAEGPHLLVGGAAGSGKTELLRSLAAALAAAARPDRLALVLIDGAPERGEGLRICTDLPHVTTYLAAGDPTRMREVAQALNAELKRREELLAGTSFDAWHAERRLAQQLSVPRQAGAHGGLSGREGPAERRLPSAQGSLKVQTRAGEPLPRLVVVVDDLDALTAPALGSPGRPAAGSVVRAVEAVARAGARLGVHLVTATGRPERTAGTEADDRSRLRVALRTADLESAALLVHVEDPAALDESVPGRGYLRRPDGAVTPFQVGRVSGRIPRTATLRPTVVPVEWERMGDPPTRRPLRELGNGPTDLALLASALQRAAESSGAEPPPPLA